MAFVTAETSVIQISGSPQGMMLVIGTYANSGGGTGGVIAAGYTNSSGSLTAITGSPSLGGRTIIDVWFTPTTNDATAPGSAKSYNTTIDADIETMVTTADSTGRYFLLCTAMGQ
jgi:hypothetical protein